MDCFEELLDRNRYAVERFVKFRISVVADADDVLQEIYLTAYQKFMQLKNKESFKPWIISIARNKCNDYFRKKAANLEIPLDALTIRELSDSRESAKKPFKVKWEELMGWFLVPKPGEKLSWGMYDIPSRKCSHVYDMEVTGKEKTVERTFVAQLTDTHCRYLATMWDDGDIKNYITFLDGDDFMSNWGFGEDNCGNETNLASKGEIMRKGAAITYSGKDSVLDVVGRYTVAINRKSYDCICVMDIENYNCGVISEQFLDMNGRTILWRRFNRDDWAIDRYKKKWSELLPENEQLTVNGATYVHWYDCITDYIL